MVTPRRAAATRHVRRFLVRFHLVRHGETVANARNVVLGQGDSPLTAEGVAVARQAAASDVVNGTRTEYWRRYASDLWRAHRTARIVLGVERGGEDGEEEGVAVAAAADDDGPPDAAGIIVDPRLRELAKGAREGYPKRFTTAEALAARREEAGLPDGADVDHPPLEDDDAAWERVRDWIDDVVGDAAEDCRRSDSWNEPDDGRDRITLRTYHVFALSHSALIRLAIHRMVGDELPRNYLRTKEGALLIPNLSRTAIDVRPRDPRFLPPKERGSRRPEWTPSLFRLTDVSHFRTEGPTAKRPGRTGVAMGL